MLFNEFTVSIPVFLPTTGIPRTTHPRCFSFCPVFFSGIGLAYLWPFWRPWSLNWACGSSSSSPCMSRGLSHRCEAQLELWNNASFFDLIQKPKLGSTNIKAPAIPSSHLFTKHILVKITWFHICFYLHLLGWLSQAWRGPVWSSCAPPWRWPGWWCPGWPWPRAPCWSTPWPVRLGCWTVAVRYCSNVGEPLYECMV